MSRVRAWPAALVAGLLVIGACVPASAGDSGEGVAEAVVRKVLGLNGVTFGGRLFMDWTEWGSHESSLESEFGVEAFTGGTEFRAARVHMKGEVSDRLGFFIDYDLAGGDAALKDAYMEYRRIAHLGNLRIGHIREPFGLEGLTSNRYTTFMEPGLQSAFYPWRNTGFMLHNTVADGILTWQVGVFRDADAFGEGSGDDELAYTVRLAGVALRTEEARQFVQLGASFSHRNPDDGIARFKAAPENHMGPVLADTGELEVDDVTLLGLEAAVGLGPVLLQGEYVWATADRLEGTSWKAASARGCCSEASTFAGYAVQVSWVLTGERRPFAKGSPGRLEPKDPLGDDGRGAFEVAVRLSGLDLADGVIDGGELRDVTIGLNWYTSSKSRIMVNYVMSDYSGPAGAEREADVEGSASALLTRFQIDF